MTRWAQQDLAIHIRIAKRSANASTTNLHDPVASGAPAEQAASDVTPRSGIPHGTMLANIERSGSTLSAKPWRVLPRETFTPIAATFSHRPTRRDSETHARGDTQCRERRDQDVFEHAEHTPRRHACRHATRQGDDRVPDQLSRP